MVKSRDVAISQRPKTQKKFAALVETLNERYSSQILSRCVITLGDEFQGLFHESNMIPDIIWDIEEGFSDPIIRLGFGFGMLHTPVQETAINVDGPTLHNARAAIERAKKDQRLGGMFVGFLDLDGVLNGVSQPLWLQRSRWTSQQRNIVSRLRKGMTQSEVADSLRISRQAVSKHANAAGWGAYLEGEAAFREILRKYIDPAMR